MTKRRFLVFALILLVVFAAIGARYTDRIRKGWLTNWLKFKNHNTFIQQRAGYIIEGDTLFCEDDTSSRAVTVIWVMNTSGGALARGDCVIWDQILVQGVDTVAYAADPDTLTIALSGAAEKSPLQIITTTWSLADACTLEITGIEFDGDALVDSVIHTATGNKYSTAFWDSISQVILLGGDANDSVAVAFHGTRNITTTTSANSALAAGVIFSATLADNAWGLMAVSGIMDSVKVNAATVEALVGRRIQTIATVKKAGPVTTITDGAPFGVLLQSGNTDGRYTVWLKRGE